MLAPSAKMVTRKAVPVPPLKTSPPPNPPYPTSPVLQSAKTTASSNTNSVYSNDLAASPAFDLIDVREAQQQQRARSDSGSSRDTWGSEGTEQDQDTTEQVPVASKPLNVSSNRTKMNGEAVSEDRNNDALPPSLRIGAAKPSVSSPNHGYEDEAQSNPWAGERIVRTFSNPNNPYAKQENGFVGDSSQQAWQEVKPPPLPANAPPPPPSNAPPPPPISPHTSTSPRPPIPTTEPPSHQLSQTSLIDDGHASWQTVEKIPVPPQGQPPFAPVSAQHDRPTSSWWQDAYSEQHEPYSDNRIAPPVVPPQIPPTHEFQPPPGPPPSQKAAFVGREDGSASPSQPTPIQTAPITPTRSTESVPETPGTMLQKQRNTTYQIRHVNWLDESQDSKARATSALRNSPIMTQNANGPCPLLALVNALVLSTPPDVETSLLETLRTREQISLGLLLDAVFDELMSGRRGSVSQNLPDVSELYSFLLALHTGMNVNPRFVTPAATPRGSWDGVPPELNGMHPMHRAQHKAGAFEETREMRLYSTFNVPLIHGWTAPSDTPVYEAFLRSAQTFEDAQNIQFLESELEDKMRVEGLSPQEEQTLDDIRTIKSFLNTWPTQLTDYGLETMSKSMQPGQIAILFRNDHFSTLYKEPKHGALMTLVTDAGYAGHDEIVWESLVDVNGAASEMFSGDFRVVSHGQDARLNQGNSGGGEEGWTTVQGKNKRVSSMGARSPSPPPLPGPRPEQAGHTHDEDVSVPMTEQQRKAAEQEDHDLALALQLQEEEEAQHREAEERRRREQELSEQYISNESEGPRPPIPPRRSQGRGTGATVTLPSLNTNTNTSTPSGRAPVNRPSDHPNDPEAPPSYEQAAADPPYRPAGSTAASGISQGNAIGAYDALRRQQSAYAQQSTSDGLPTFAQIGASSPPYSVSSPQTRRQSQPNRVRRESQVGGFTSMSPQRTNQIGFGNPVQRSVTGQGGLSPGHHPRSSQARSTQRLSEVNGAASIKEADDRCVVM